MDIGKILCAAESDCRSVRGSRPRPPPPLGNNAPIGCQVAGHAACFVTFGVTWCRFCLIAKEKRRIHSRFRIRWHRVTSARRRPIQPAGSLLARRAYCGNFPRRTIHPHRVGASGSLRTHITPSDLHHICQRAHAALPSAFKNLISALSGTTAEAWRARPSFTTGNRFCEIHARIVSSGLSSIAATVATE